MDVTTAYANSPGFTVSCNVGKRKLEYASGAWDTLFDRDNIIYCETQHLDVQVGVS